jgi:hypothetical protein
MDGERLTLRAGACVGEKGSHLGLEDLDELQLPSSLQFKTLELGERAVLIEDGVPFLDQLPLLLAGGQDHGLPCTNQCCGWP